MPFTWRINIKPGPAPGQASFEFEELPQVQVGDQIFWSNDDTAPHWPALDGNPTFFMSNQIAGTSTSSSFTPSREETITYICSLHPGETGTIEVGPPPPEE
jgi:plastocyanin